ncbi:hypothetical protein MVEN_02375000 [Mycena venus]|uniref:Uncharacterized protein n=1 Tax=Mycena venus TaxID=2733690 RepID=A0A8H6X2Q2_9AGAR|nr:hypothetical protein MVEN_02375000 [Mycena venus]
MDNKTRTSPEDFTPQRNLGTCNAASVHNSAGDINISGCITNVTYSTSRAVAPTVGSDFHTIALGDIDLQREIKVDYATAVVELQHERTCVRRVYSARVNGTGVTLTVYQGYDAGEVRRTLCESCAAIKCRSNGSKIWISISQSGNHPNLLQLWGTVSLGKIHAMVFHDDLVPLREFVSLQSPCTQVYIYAYCSFEFRAARQYLKCACQLNMYWDECTLWIRRSTGQLCADLTSSRNPIYLVSELDEITNIQTRRSPSALYTEAVVSEFLTLEAYHKICWFNLKQSRHITVSLPMTVRLGAVICCPSSNGFDELIEIARLVNVEIYHSRWTGGPVGETMEDGCTRFECRDVLDSNFQLSVLSTGHSKSWLSQANYMFCHLGITSNLEDYAVFVCCPDFRLSVSGAAENTPSGYLFLCPAHDFQIGPSSFKWPDCPAYWSLDPSGVKRLTMEQAERLGFPSVRLRTGVWGFFWDESVYAGLRQFHQAKGFDPESQDVARHLGCGPFELAPNMNVPFGHVDGAGSCGDEQAGIDGTHKLDDTPSSSRGDQGDTGGGGLEMPNPHDEIIPVSMTLKFLLNLELVLILFLALSSLCD